MLKRLHPVAGAIAILMIATFWLSTTLSELFGAPATVVAVKSAVPWGLLVLVPALALTAGTGFKRAGGRRIGLVPAKIGRMPWIAANGVLILVPSALYLAWKAQAGTFDASFYAVQALELAAGACNLVLLGLNMRDGLRMTATSGAGLHSRAPT
ncbi:hypothetical protein [Prosthecodimorpha staleyi]|uniref:Transmembrane protein n=1 Tax=Prosthecodimorpha staleyi TaxID=2840188 RepID=A0A947D214_9HYPH|nr:hypothetical protein [Prosthecodimorpha staleyi]MBT9289330.1 hypothetical protein [Prosthecodimorpha staleyi]